MNKDIYIIVEDGLVRQVFFNDAPDETENDQRTAVVINVESEALETLDTRNLIANYVTDSVELDEVAITFPNFLGIKAEIVAALMREL